METKSFEEIETYVCDFLEHASPEEIVDMYEVITNKKVKVKDWEE